MYGGFAHSLHPLLILHVNVFSGSGYKQFHHLAKLFRASSILTNQANIKSKLKQSVIVINFDNHVMSQHGGHFRHRGFSYSVRFIRYLFGNTRAIYP